MNKLAIKYMILASGIFAVMNIMVKYLDHIPIAQIVMMRSIVMFIFVSVMVYKQRLNPLGKQRKWLLARGLFGTLGIALFFYTVHQMPLATAVVIHYFTPFFTAIIAYILVKEKILPQQLYGFLLCILGVILIKGFDYRVELVPLIIGIVGTISAAIAYNIIHYLKKTEHHLVIMFYFPAVTIPITAIYIWVTGDWVWCDNKSWVVLSMIGGMTYFAQYFLTKAYQIGEVNKVSSISYSGIVYALVFGYVLFGEWFNTLAMAGIVLVVTGVLINVLAKSRITK